MYVIILAVGIVLIILTFVFIPKWVVIVSLLSFLSSSWYYMMNKEQGVIGVALVFYCLFLYSWYSTSSFVTDETKAWIQLVAVFSVFILFVYFKQKDSFGVGSVLKWTFVLVLVAFILSTIVTIIVKLATHWNRLTNLFFMLLVCGGLYAAAVQFPSYFNIVKSSISGLLDRLKDELHSTKPIVVWVLVFETIVMLVYFFYHSLKRFFFKQHNGHLLLNHPTQLGEYNKLDLFPKFVYNYALSGWFWINSVPSNKGFMSILNYGQIPNITFSPLKNKIRITTKGQSGSIVTVCEIPEIPLQKWNHILINNNKGIMDVFLNGKLFRSVQGIVPYKSNEFLSTGQVGGIEGGICNVMYFERPLEISKIKQLYHSFKNYNPPIV